MSSGWAVPCFLLMHLLAGAHGFRILPGKSMSHMEITERAILNVTVQVCRALAQAEGTDFTLPVRTYFQHVSTLESRKFSWIVDWRRLHARPQAQPFTAEGVAAACGAPKSSKSFSQAITLIKLMNMRVDIRHVLNASYHFDEEMFLTGRKIITEGLLAVKASNKQGNYVAARQKLGEILHPLQVFNILLIVYSQQMPFSDCKFNIYHPHIYSEGFLQPQ